MSGIKVVHWGLGAMGCGIAKWINAKKGLRSIAAFDLDSAKLGRDLGEIVGLGHRLDVVICEPPQYKFPAPEADIAIIATGSFTRDVFAQIKMAAIAGVNVITIAEEMAFPAAREPQLAAQLDSMSKQAGVTILGTGINPGFVLDTFVIALSGTCLQVKKITATRINDLAPFGPTVMASQGVGTTPEEFKVGLEAGSIVGHIGFLESITSIAKALGWEIDEILESREPIISSVRRKTAYALVEPGNVAGCRHTAIGLHKGEVLIELIHPQQILPELEEVETGDFINIQGVPDIAVRICPEIPGGLGTMAMAVNMIPQVVAARPGLMTMAELPVPAAIVGDVQSIIKWRRGEC